PAGAVDENILKRSGERRVERGQDGKIWSRRSGLRKRLERDRIRVVAVLPGGAGVAFVPFKSRYSVHEQPEKIARESFTRSTRIRRKANVEIARQGPCDHAVNLGLHHVPEELVREVLNLARQRFALRRVKRADVARISARELSQVHAGVGTTSAPLCI